MKVGIITFHHTTNYGATLQAYALWETLVKQGHETELIDYRPYGAVQYYRQKIFMPEEKNRGKKYFILNLFKNFLPNLKRYVRMRHFLTSTIKLSEKILNRKDLPSLFENGHGYDAIVAGSDQIWCTISIRGFDPSYFLDFIPKSSKCRKISYAASFGPAKALADAQEAIVRLIGDFDAVSVRDSNSLDIVQRNCGEVAIRVLDPTFLTTFRDIIPSQRRSPKPYLLLYLERQISPEERTFIWGIAERKGLEVVSIGDSYGIADKVLVDAGPKEWLWYFKHASTIITNFYHGTIFSIKFNKQFTVLSRESKMNKVKDLLDMLSLSRRMVTKIDADTLVEQLIVINYEPINKRLSQEIIKSHSYLSDALAQANNISLAKENMGLSSVKGT